MRHSLLAVLAGLAAGAIAGQALADGASAAAVAGGSAGASAAPPAKATSAADPDANKVVCKREEVTGSNFPAHVCHTKAEWAAIAERNDRETHDAYRQTQNIGPH
ncbi:hypothetical protein ACO2Q3_19945 [Caulobacter sp. KR2-114]|uniref:hypothetical protein n=1 Tax=Caulobacter sp. KR2-114 TaxID=3400912 RepID=UPI003C0A7FA1